ncbi:TetR/AcrR family transcriptional regulator C-terminal domain-containing protein [Modestobacter italicus]|uniref:TetR/AcrR family transcriptional regulator C-terminal domain-containing protein n=1 Tax=Modestobacter italicus (strain DSM 44449 / CECT 9708 / BC 501) TaxID=2732864 RepID=UPI001C967798|nr:TetR/AcrR family transcriptional regulator C-terminal domain-containing protein [Modestobacter italicus]
MIPERPGVTRAAVVTAALELLAEGGLEAVSFRRIAGRLGVSAPTLYWHVESKRQLMDLMADELAGRARRGPLEPAPGEPWWSWLRTHAQQMFDALVEVRDAPRVLAGNRPVPESFPAVEGTLGVLVDAGLTPGDAQQALFAIGAYVIGSATEWQAEAERAATRPLPDPDDSELDAGRAEVLAEQPLLLAAMREILHRPHTAAFEFGLDLLIDGLRARVTR